MPPRRLTSDADVGLTITLADEPSPLQRACVTGNTQPVSELLSDEDAAGKVKLSNERLA